LFCVLQNSGSTYRDESSHIGTTAHHERSTSTRTFAGCLENVTFELKVNRDHEINDFRLDKHFEPIIILTANSSCRWPHSSSLSIIRQPVQNAFALRCPLVSRFRSSDSPPLSVALFHSSHLAALRRPHTGMRQDTMSAT
jgi:hypothetical protein